MRTEVWFRNPSDYIRELVECRTALVAWDRGILVKRSIDPHKHAELYFGGAGLDYRLLIIGDQGAAEITPDHPFDNPKAVYPVWEYGDDFENLESMVANPVGDDPESVNDSSLMPDERPVRGQEHRVVVNRFPHAGSGPGRAFLRHVRDLQNDFPDCIIHIHGLYGYGAAFGLGFRSVDLEPRSDAQKGRVLLPSGKKMTFEHTVKVPKWVEVIGFTPADLKIPRNRCMFNIKSAIWAGENYRDNVKFKVRGDSSASDASKTSVPTIHADKSPYIGTAGPGDKVACNSCSLARSCTYYRAGAVCSIPGTESAGLARMFQTRNSDDIITALGSIVGKQAERAEKALQEEEDYDLIDPDVTRLLHTVFTEGAKLAKLVNPSLGEGAKVGIFVGPGGVAKQITEKELTSSIVAELEARGIDRSKITPAMIEEFLKESNPHGGAMTVPAVEAGS